MCFEGNLRLGVIMLNDLLITPYAIIQSLKCLSSTKYIVKTVQIISTKWVPFACRPPRMSFIYATCGEFNGGDMKIL